MTPEQREYLLGLDPATLLPSPEVDALVAKVWMGYSNVYISCGRCYAILSNAASTYAVHWFPSTNPAHAGEARRVAEPHQVLCVDTWLLRTITNGENEDIAVIAWIGSVYGRVEFSDTDGDKGRAEALAITRAIVAAMQAAETQGRNHDD